MNKKVPITVTLDPRLREWAEHADEDRVTRMRAHIDAQAAALGLSDGE
jgi:hypothetical protein